MVHAKTMVVDGLLSTIGTSNMDYRSFEINFEITAIFYNEGISKKMKEIFEEDVEHCEKVDIEDWEDRAFWEKVKESFSRLWAPLL